MNVLNVVGCSVQDTHVVREAVVTNLVQKTVERGVVYTSERDSESGRVNGVPHGRDIEYQKYVGRSSASMATSAFQDPSRYA